MSGKMDQKKAQNKVRTRRDFLKRAVAAGGMVSVAGIASAYSPSPVNAAPSNPIGATVPTAAQATSLLDTVLQRGKLIVGATLTIPPFGYKDSDGKPTGFDIDMAHILANALFGDREKVEFFEQEMDARIPNLATGKVDVCIQLITVTAQRAQTVEFSIPYYREAITTMALANSPYAGAKDMSGKKVKISILQNTFAEDLVHIGIPDAEVLQFDTVANSILAVDGGRADAYVGGYGEINYFNAQSPSKYKIGNVGWVPQTYAAAVRPGDARWLNWINTALHEAMTGVDFSAYQTAFKKYFGVELADPPYGFPIEFGARGGEKKT